MKLILISLMLLASSAAYSSRSASVLDRAKRVIRQIDYIPFSSTRDGCYARALYMGMELTIHGIPASNQYIFGNLKPERNINWSYHVAPMIEVGGVARFAVFDPSFAKEPMTRQRWIKYSRPVGQSQTYISPVTHYRKTSVQKYQYRRPGYSYSKRVKTMRQLPMFKISNIANACKVAWEHIGKENLSSGQKFRKRRRLMARTNYLVDRLQSLQKLPYGAKVMSCKNAKYRR